MIENLKLQLITLTEAVHRRVFGQGRSDEMRKFLKTPFRFNLRKQTRKIAKSCLN
jgi:hypothetical protein